MSLTVVGAPAITFAQYSVSTKYVRMVPGMVGCVGHNKNPAVSKWLLDLLSPPEIWPDIALNIRTCGNLAVSCMGEFPEVGSLKSHERVLVADPNELILHKIADTADRLAGIKSLFENINYSQYVAAVADYNETSVTVRLICDGGKLHVVDMRDKLGLIFWFKDPAAWTAAVNHLNSFEAYESLELTQPLVIDFPDLHIWSLTFDNKYPYQGKYPGWEVRKFKVTRTKYYGVNNESPT